MSGERFSRHTHSLVELFGDLVIDVTGANKNGKRERGRGKVSSGKALKRSPGATSSAEHTARKLKESEK